MLPPCSLYIHIPWCIKKCPYCDFNSHQQKADLPEAKYIDALLSEFKTKKNLLQNRPIKSIFIGGGTPSLFSGESLERLLQGIQIHANFVDDIEITLEANPGTVEHGPFADFLDAGINRLSLGVQSFQTDKLSALGRIHDSESAKHAVIAAQNSGFTNINIDLMFGLPKQTTDDALYDLTTAIALKPTHISWYQLTREPNTLFYKHPPALPSSDEIDNLQQAGLSVLAKYGYLQYEISAYAKDHQTCVHNINYWTFGDYLGIGAGAHSKITQARDGAIFRHWNLKHPTTYLNTENKVGNTLPVTTQELPLEYCMNHFRLKEPVQAINYERDTGCSFVDLSNNLIQAETDTLLKRSPHTITLTKKGYAFLNDILLLLS